MKKIAIIGGGISGLYFANLLQKNQDYKYKIFEKKNFFELNDSYGIQLSVNSIKLLNEIGFKNIQAYEVAFPKKVNFFDAKNCNKIIDIDISKFNYENNRYTTLKRSTLLNFLLKNIPENNIVHNCELTNVNHEDKISLVFSNNHNEKFDKHKKYDLITYWDVFEHLTDINSEIIHINKFLKNNSFLLLNIPDYGSLFRKLLGFKWPFFLDVHLYYFENKTCRSLPFGSTKLC